MIRGYSLEKDLKLLINNPKYSDIEMLCEDCRAILAARSEVFDRLLYNGMKESYENQISFPKLVPPGWKLYWNIFIRDKENIVEAFNAADYFQLPSIQDFIVKTLKNTLKKNHTKNFSPELLSKIAEIMPFIEDNVLLNLLIETVAIIPLNTIEFGRLSIVSNIFYLIHMKKKNLL